jgi:hypothetical protein
VLSLIVAGCASKDTVFSDGGSDIKFTEGGTVCQAGEGDDDGDGILDGDEGCFSGRDTDNDKIPDWQDFDSDNDGIPDSVEKGAKDGGGKCVGAKPGKDAWPCDSDGDGTPDYLDVDSDNDTVLDKDEDPTGDGLLGCCLTTCGKPDDKYQKGSCILTADGCGSGQKCESGKCTPTIDFHCSNGETSPKLKDSFGDGKLDNERGTFICRDATEDKPKGRKTVQLRKSTAGDWHVALEKTGLYGELAIQAPAAKEAAGVIDESAPSTEVAGFIISRDSTKAKVQDEFTDILAAIQKRIPAGPGTATVRASGAEVKSHDKYDSIQGTIIDLTLSTSTNISNVRNELIGTLMGKQMGQLGNLPAPYGSSGTEFVIRFVTVKRFAFKKNASGQLELDAKGFPIDDGDQAKWRIVVMGAVALKANYQDPSRQTGFVVDDLSNGTAVAIAADSVGDECDVSTITSLPVADIVWIVDESGSMDDNRQDIVNNANNFFSRALSSGLDFRMGVTNVCDPGGTHKAAVGKFCSKASTNTSDDGGQDRFLLPSEQTIFSACINNPPGYEGGSEYGLINGMEAVKKHLPRASGVPDKIRPEAKLVLIMVTDEVPEELGGGILAYSDFDKCQLDAAKQAAVNNYLKPHLDLYQGATDPEAAAMYHLIGGVCNNSCSADVGHGYRELAQALGGQIGDVCQKDLGNTLQVIIDSIVGAASPVKLDYVPISASLAAAMDGVEIKRSRTNGFDYRSSSNSLAFINVKYKKGSEVVASYKRWRRQCDIDKGGC